MGKILIVGLVGRGAVVMTAPCTNINLIVMKTKKLKNYLAGTTSLFFMLFNASQFGTSGNAFWLLGTIAGLFASVLFFNLNDN